MTGVELHGDASGRAMGWDGAVNAWHVSGGIYRMGRREWLTAAGWEDVYDDGIRTVVDLRNQAEVRQRDTDPAVVPDAVEVDVIAAPTEVPGDARFEAICGPYLNNPAHYAANAELFPAKLVGVFRAIAAGAEEGDVVVHCAAGRDRSGMIAAMVQHLAGDSDQDIAAGYERAARGINERYRTHGPPHARERYLEEAELAPLLAVRRELVVRFVRDLDPRTYLLRHGLPAADLDAVCRLAGAAVAP